MKVFAAQGCGECREGYKGRLGLFELMIVNTELADAIRSPHPNLLALRELAVSGGMKTLLDDGVGKLAQGLVSFAELLRVIGRPSS